MRVPSSHRQENFHLLPTWQLNRRLGVEFHVNVQWGRKTLPKVGQFVTCLAQLVRRGLPSEHQKRHHPQDSKA